MAHFPVYNRLLSTTTFSCLFWFKDGLTLASSRHTTTPTGNKMKRKTETIEISDSEDEVKQPPAKRAVQPLAMTRKQMEEERLARAAARNPLGEQPVASSSRIGIDYNPLPVRADGTPVPVRVEYPIPTIKTTFNSHFPNDSNSLSFAQLMGDRKTLKSALLSALNVELEWLFPQFDGLDIPVTVIMNGKTAIIKASQTHPNFTQIIPVFQSPTDLGTMHAKFAFFFHRTYTRIVIMTANLMGIDWDYIENSIWLVDLPLPPADFKPPPSAFLNTFSVFLTMVKIPQRFWKDELCKLDYSVIDKTCRLVASVQGTHRETDAAFRLRQVGFPAFAKALEELHVQPKAGEVLHLECQGSSLGQEATEVCTLKSKTDVDRPKWYKLFYATLAGITVPKVPRTIPIKVLFPSQRIVNASIAGLEGAGSWFFSRKDWRFPDGTGRILSSLLGYAVNKQGIVGKKGFLYLGSHNFTPGAWGRFKEKGKREPPRLSLSNTELGIVMAITGDVESQLDELVTYQRPVEMYTAQEIPYFINEMR